jgi:hypothetical protein
VLKGSWGAWGALCGAVVASASAAASCCHKQAGGAAGQAAAHPATCSRKLAGRQWGRPAVRGRGGTHVLEVCLRVWVHSDDAVHSSHGANHLHVLQCVAICNG